MMSSPLGALLGVCNADEGRFVAGALLREVAKRVQLAVGECLHG